MDADEQVDVQSSTLSTPSPGLMQLQQRRLTDIQIRQGVHVSVIGECGHTVDVRSLSSYRYPIIHSTSLLSAKPTLRFRGSFFSRWLKHGVSFTIRKVCSTFEL